MTLMTGLQPRLGICDIRYNDSDVVHLASVEPEASLLSSSREWGLSVAITRSLSCKGDNVLGCNLRGQPSPSGVNYHSHQLIIIQVVKQAICACNNNISCSNLQWKYLPIANWQYELQNSNTQNLRGLLIWSLLINMNLSIIWFLASFIFPEPKRLFHPIIVDQDKFEYHMILSISNLY